ncbi:MAG: hypothetical protein HOA23_00005, partial [Gemmatimonadales bacterium]|nr:hypothetical protein [Gemmatimonadales bacterium]
MGTPSEWAYQQLVPAGTYRVVVRAGGETMSTRVKVRVEPMNGVLQAPLRWLVLFAPAHHDSPNWERDVDAFVVVPLVQSFDE